MRERVWPHWQADTFDASHIHFQLHELRRALRPALNGQECIQSIAGAGVRFLLPAKRVEAFPPDTDDQSAEQPNRTASRAFRGWLAVVLGFTLAGLALVSAIGFFGSFTNPQSLRIAQIVPVTSARLHMTPYPLLADTSRVYFGVGSLAPTHAVPVTGGDVSSVVQGTLDIDILDVNPFRPEFLAARRTQSSVWELWTYPVATGVPRRLGNLETRSAAWSTDARYIAIASSGDLYIADHNGATLRKLETPKPGDPWWPRWSPDGRRIRFTRQAPRDRMAPVQSLWEINSDGSGLRQIASPEPSAEACCGNWSPDGDTYVFHAVHDGRADLWALTHQRDPFRVTRVAPLRLTAGPLSFTGPVFSRDGRTVFAVGTLPLGELVKLSASQRELVPYLRGLSATWVTYSPDRQWLAYVSYPDNKLWKQRLDGSGKLQLAGGPFELDGSTWSPDGRWIAFRSRIGGTSKKIYLIRPDGGEAQAISDEDREQGIPSWSPDSKRFVFGDVPARFGQPEGSEVLHIYDVVHKELAVVPGSESRGLWTARWSPDGRYIAALTIQGQSLRIYDFKTGRWRSFEANHLQNPTWTRDGSHIHYITEGGTRILRRLRVSDGMVEDIADLKDYPTAAYWWSGLAPDDSPILLRNLGAPEVYALRLEPRGR